MILVLKGAWYTDERAKKFIIPKDPIGASVIGFTVTERKTKINIKISQILPNKRENWYQSLHKMHSGMLSRTTTIA